MHIHGHLVLPNHGPPALAIPQDRLAGPLTAISPCQTSMPNFHAKLESCRLSQRNPGLLGSWGFPPLGDSRELHNCSASCRQPPAIYDRLPLVMGRRAPGKLVEATRFKLWIREGSESWFYVFRSTDASSRCLISAEAMPWHLIGQASSSVHLGHRVGAGCSSKSHKGSSPSTAMT